MPPNVSMGAMISCSMAEIPAPMPLTCEAPPSFVEINEMPAATIMHMVPFDNIPSFGMCRAPLNPTVIAATAAALGTPTPGACIPVIVGPWEPGALTVKFSGIPALTADSMCMCAYAGEISIVSPGQVQVEST